MTSLVGNEQEPGYADNIPLGEFISFLSSPFTLLLFLLHIVIISHPYSKYICSFLIISLLSSVKFNMKSKQTSFRRLLDGMYGNVVYTSCADSHRLGECMHFYAYKDLRQIVDSAKRRVFVGVPSR